jgi:hypothetical protein
MADPSKPPSINQCPNSVAAAYLYGMPKELNKCEVQLAPKCPGISRQAQITHYE